MDKLNEYISKAEKLRKEWGSSDAARDSGIVPENVKEFTDIEYTVSADVSDRIWHRTDIYYPAAEHKGKYPVIISVHGGGWFYGDKELYSLYARHLTSYGFAAVNFNYRLSPEHQYPAAFEDVCRLMAFIKDNAEKYDLDTEHLYITGDSAGAQLAAQYCVYASSADYRELFGNIRDISFIIPAKAALNCGIYKVSRQDSDEICKWYIPEDLSDNLQKSITGYLDFINKDFPETYVMCSVNDPLTPRSKELMKAFDKTGVKYEYHEYGQDNKNDGHVFHLDLRSKNGQLCNINETEFFRK